MHPPIPSSPFPRPARALALPGLVGVLCFTAWALPASLLLVSSRRPVAPGASVGLGVALAAVLVLGVEGVSRRAAGARAGLVLAVGLLAQALMPTLGAFVTMAEAVVSSHWRCGTGDVAFVMTAPFVSLALALVGVAVTALAVRRAGARAATWAGRAGLAACAAAAVAVAVGATTVARPTLYDWLAAMPEVGVIPEATLGPRMAPRVDMAGSRLVWRRCDEHGCDLALRDPTATHESGTRGTVRVTGEALRVRMSPGDDLGVIERAATGDPVGAFDARTGAPLDISWRTVARRVAPPTTWWPAAALGLALAAASVARGRRRASALRAWEGAAAGTLGDDGALRVEGESVALQGEASAPAGDVLVLRDDASTTPFRGQRAVAAACVRAGTHASLREELALEQGAAWALAGAVAAWCATPLALALAAMR